MQIQRYFVVQANEALKSLIKDYEDRYGDGFVCPLSSVELWRKSTIGIMGKPINRQFRTDAEIKFIFLLNLHDDYFQESHQDKIFYHFLKRVLGEPPYTEHIFDQWWTLERAGSCEDIEVAEKLFEEKGLWNLISSE